MKEIWITGHIVDGCDLIDYWREMKSFTSKESACKDFCERINIKEEELNKFELVDGSYEYSQRLKDAWEDLGFYETYWCKPLKIES